MEKLFIFGGEKINNREFPSWPQYNSDDELALLDVLHSGYWSQSNKKVLANSTIQSYVDRFESKIAEKTGCKHVLAVSNGTNALEIAVKAIGIIPGDEVIVSSYSFVSTVSCVLAAGAIPVFADINYHTWNMDADSLRKSITSKTKAVIPVHFGGLPCDMKQIMAVAKEHDLIVIEDAAQALGASISGKWVGNFGDIGCFSLQSSKNLTCGEGGIITTDNEEYYQKMYSLHNLGRVENGFWYEHKTWGSNYRITEFQAALACSQFRRLEEQEYIRRNNAIYLSLLLHDIPGIKLREVDSEKYSPVYHLYCFTFHAECWNGLSRKRFVMLLNSEGIPCSEGYKYPLYKYKYVEEYCRLNRADSINCCEVCEEISEKAVWLHNNILLGDKEQIENIAKAIWKIKDNLEYITR